ncbi:hypothetical protein PDO_4922 [Rhizobium sp. PDO1-076]|uniref:HipA family kinase n=1 Tax=Rhizobium sp. PDO1-076 TaxID=1125979 RepID=UPI00024E3AE5|nr:HipA family kinase [Rhizobium sp. PDO1-076]EHS52046.1 hypothetical protein PDO_4922 [Rhizobium sp. PDO1-076]
MPLVSFPSDIQFDAVIQTLETSAQVVKASLVDGSVLFLKGPPPVEGDTMLLREWIGTGIAEKMGLPTLDYGYIRSPDIVAHHLARLSHLRTDVIFASHEATGFAWDRSITQLSVVRNVEDFTTLVVLDTLLRNADRYFIRSNGVPHENSANVFIRLDQAGNGTLMAIDHTHVLGSDAVLQSGAASDKVSDPAVYGMFPEFRQHIDLDVLSTTLDQVNGWSRDDLVELAMTTPPEWGMSAGRAELIGDFLEARVAYIVNNLNALIANEL